jgi:hypothetical protein
VLEHVALATDFVLIELQKLTATSLFAVEVRLNGEEVRRLGARPSAEKACFGNGEDGGRHRDRTCDHSRVKGVLYR